MSIIIEKEFLEQILEALEMAEQLETDGRVDFKKYSLRTDKDIIAKYKVAISAIKEAIVAPVQEPLGYVCVHANGKISAWLGPCDQEFRAQRDALGDKLYPFFDPTPPAAQPTTEKSSAVQPAPVQPVGVVGTMPGAIGFTMACFEAAKVPVGTKLYTTPSAAPEKSSTLTIDVFFQEGDDPFICYVNGKVTPYALCEIESQICQNPDFENGDGTYRYEVRWVKGQYGDEGQCEIAPYWELTDIGFEPIQYTDGQ